MQRPAYIYRHLLLFLICLCFSYPAFSVEITWTAHDRSTGTGPSPVAACTDLAEKRSLGNEKWSFNSAQIVTTTQYQCLFDITDIRYPSYKTTTTSPAYRSGDTCPSGQALNSGTGLCEATCSDTVGESLLVRGDDAVVINSNGTNYVASQAPESICSLSCSYAPVSNFSASCYLVAGSTSTGYCNYIVEGTGDSCNGSNLVAGDASGDPLNPADPGDGGEPEEPDPCHGVPGYEWDGSTCVKTGDEGGDDGSGDGGDGSGDGDGDGSGDGDGGDGSGDGGSGGDGGGSGDGDGDGSGGGGGSGDGGCTGEDCGEGEGGGLNRPEKGNFEEAIAEYDQKITDTLAEIKDQSGQFGSLIEQKMAIPLNSGNAVLPCFEADIAGRTVGFCLSDNADQLAILRNILLFLATVIALFIIFREDK